MRRASNSRTSPYSSARACKDAAKVGKPTQSAPLRALGLFGHGRCRGCGRRSPSRRIRGDAGGLGRRLGSGSDRTAHRRTAFRLRRRNAPFRESGYRYLMQVLELRENRAEALQVYEELRQLLRNELGISPSPATQALHRRLLR